MGEGSWVFYNAIANPSVQIHVYNLCVQFMCIIHVQNLCSGCVVGIFDIGCQRSVVINQGDFVHGKNGCILCRSS